MKKGKGFVKEYSNYKDKFIFEREYLYGKRNRKGKIYNISGEIFFKGEYIYGHIKKGKEYKKEN